MIDRRSDESKNLIIEIREAIKTMNPYKLRKYFHELYLKFGDDLEDNEECYWHIRNARLDIGTKVEETGNYPYWGIIRNIIFSEFKNAPAEYIYEADFDFGRSQYFLSELVPVITYNKEKLKIMQNGTHKDKKLLNKVSEVINKFKLADEFNYADFQIGENEIGTIAYSIKTYNFDYIVELAYEISHCYDYSDYGDKRYHIAQEDCIEIARELMISIFNYEPPLEEERYYILHKRGETMEKKEKNIPAQLCSGVFWVISDDIDFVDYTLLAFNIPCDVYGNIIGTPEIPLNAKSGKTYNHRKLWESQIQKDPAHKPYNKKWYSYYPRGRVDIANNRATIYLNPLINKEEIVFEIKQKFGLIEPNITDVRILADGSSHYWSFFN